MYPILLEPAYQNYVWGGTRIPELFRRNLPPARYAESWEVSDRSEGMSRVANGIWKGMTLRELLLQEGDKLVGVGQDRFRFPLLIKIIDAKENLSIQVHPNERTAPLLNGEPKTEMWIAIEESWVYAGLKEGTTSLEFEQSIQETKAEESLRKIKLNQGDAILIPGGTVHAICAGALLLEIQQNSNTTYRLYDWGRVGRPLHLKEGFLAIEWNQDAPQKVVPHNSQLRINTPYFIVDNVRADPSLSLAGNSHTCQILFCVAGQGEIEGVCFQKGQTFVIPAALSSARIQGNSEWIRIMLVPRSPRPDRSTH